MGALHERWRYHFSDGATSGPAVYDGAVYIGGWNGHLYAADAVSGTPRWQRQRTPMGVRSTPLVTEDRVYAAAGTKLVALARSDGASVWETALDPAVFELTCSTASSS